MRYVVKVPEVQAVQYEDGMWAVRNGDDVKLVAPGTFEQVWAPANNAKPSNGNAKQERAPRAKRQGQVPARATSTGAEPARKGGRKPIPWFCRSCSHNTAGPQCGACGADRPARAEREPAKPAA